MKDIADTSFGSTGLNIDSCDDLLLPNGAASRQQTLES